jgi:short-subunit dehydrogenase
LIKNRKVILITGASAGLGLCLAKKLKNQNFHLILTSRSTSLSRFEEQGFIESEHLWIRPLDVTSKIERENLISEINVKLDGVDILVNNAGFSFRAVVEHVQDEDRVKQMETNFRGPMELVRLVLPKMRERLAGNIINISSVGGMMAMPTMAVYSASKWALEGATESLWYEVKPWNIHVTLVQPGFINSESFRNVRFTEKSAVSLETEKDPYHKYYFYMSDFIEKIMRFSPSSAVDVAEKVIKVIKAKNPPLRVAGTLDAHIFGILRRFMPRQLYHLLLYYNLPGIKEIKKSNHYTNKLTGLP